MPPTRRPLGALGSLQLVCYANNPTRVITELAFIADAQVNVSGDSEQHDVDAPLEVQFEEFMDGVNSRGRGTKTRQRKMTVEQAAAVLLVTVQKGHVELTVKPNDPHTIDVIRVLPEAKRILAAFLPKLRGYGDIPYDQQYRGAIALAKRHFFPNGKPPTKKELMALLLQCYQEKKELSRRALGVQTSLNTLDGSSSTEAASGESATGVDSAAFANSGAELPNNEIVVDVEHNLVAPDADPSLDIGDIHDLPIEDEAEPVQLLTRTPAAPRTLNPYMTPVSNPRRVNHPTDTPSSPITSPTLVPDNHSEVAPDEDRPIDEEIGGMMQAMAVSQGRWNHYYNKFIEACHRITFLEREKAEIQSKFDSAKKLLDETAQCLQEANVENSRLKRWGDTLSRQLDFANQYLSMLRGMLTPAALEDVE